MAENRFKKYVAPSGGGVIVGDPYAAAEERRKAEDQVFQRNADTRAVSAEQRAADAEARANAAEARAAAKEGRDEATMDARGGVESTESERTAAFLATRLAGGIQDLQRIGMGRAPSLFEVTAGQTTLGNLATEEDWQRTLAAQRDITDAVLTLGTGAAYTAEQIDAYRKSYFPQPGDADTTIADKKIRLERALAAAKLKAGASAGMIDDALGSMFASVDPAAGAKAIQDALKAGKSREEILAIAARYNLSPDEAALNANLASRSAGGPTSDVLPPQDYRDSIVGQGVSGINEGIASTLGLPADAMTWAMNLVPQGINAVANTDLPTIDDPVLGGDWWRDKMDDWAIYDESSDPAAQFARRVGESVGASVVPAGFAGTAGRAAAALASGTAGGIGGATAQQVAPGNVEAEIIAELLAGGASGAGFAKAGQRARQRVIEDAVPTVDDLKQQASSLYKQAEARGVTADPMMTQQLADDLRKTLRSEGRISPTGRISEVYPKTKEAMQLADDFAGQPMNPTQMQTVRSVVADGMNSAEPAERRIAGLLLDTFDDFVDPLAPDLADARGVASRYLNAEKLERARELAGARAGQFTGSGFENALRTEYRALDRNTIKGRDRYGDEVLKALMDVSRGTPGSNAARAAGRFAPTGVVSGTLATGIPFSIGNAIGGPAAGAMASIATVGAGTAGRVLATKMGIRNADIAELTARNGGALDKALLMDDGTEALIAAMSASELAKYLEDEQAP